jgi:uncharacterized protein UPF0182
VPPKTARLVVTLAVVIALLFAGRWTAGLLADRWWAGQISPAARGFITNWALVELAVSGLGVVTACAWFVGHLFIVYRAIGSVQIHRQVGNLEIREAVNARVLAGLSVVGGLLLGLLVGQGVGDWTGQIILAARSVPYGGADPLLGEDIAFYVTRLPLWRLLHNHLALLVLLGLLGSLLLYFVIGAVAWRDGRPAINTHARVHLGLLACMLAMLLVWGYLLEPYELVAGVGANLHDGLFEYRMVAAQVLAGPALAASLLSLVWVWRGNHALMTSSWLLVLVGSLLGHHVIPAMMSGAPNGPLDAADRRRLDQVAYGMAGIRDSVFHPADQPLLARPHEPGVWPAGLVPQATGDSGATEAFDRSLLPAGRHTRPVWLVVRSRADQTAALHILADDRTTPLGRPLLLQDDDSVRGSSRLELNLSASSVWPGLRDVVLDSSAHGIQVGSGLRRVALAWALQRGAILGGGVANLRASWYLDPATRLARLAPFAVWSVPVPRLIAGEVVWLCDGYVASATFPGSVRTTWRGRELGSLRAAFVGVVQATTGVTHIYLRHTADDILGQAWLRLADGVVESASAIPPEVARTVGYPLELLGVQAEVLESAHWGVGRMPGPIEGAPPSAARNDAVWEPDTSGVQYTIPFGRPPEHQLSAVLKARMVDGWETLRVIRFDSILSLPEPATLDSRWARFPTFQQLRDSVERGGAKVESTPVRYWVTAAGLGAYQTHFAIGPNQDPTLVWVSVAVGDRRGAGHDLDEAWQNMLGLSAPLVSAAERGVILLEARRYLDAADAALRRGDLEAFGRAFEALKRTLRPDQTGPRQP